MKTLFKNIMREFSKAPGRFIALLLIVILSAAFFTGLRSVAPSMRLTADTYFNKTHLSDFRLLSDIGLTEEDATALRSLTDVTAVMPLYTADVLALKGDSVSVLALRSLPTNTAQSNKDYLNRLTLSEGRLPLSADECVADSGYSLKIGDVVWVTDDNAPGTLSRFAVRSFTVVGIAKTPTYIAIDRGSTNIGTGTVASYLFVMEDAFRSDYYTELDIRFKSTAGLSAFSKEYAEIIETKADELAAIGQERIKVRYDAMQQSLSAAGASYAAENANLLASIESSQWHILSRDDNPGYTGFSSDAERVGSISVAITLFLYIVAALVCLTTMTRLVEEQRIQIGTLKALGYNQGIIQFKFFFYAAFIGIIGGGIGVLVGLFSFPTVIWDAYATLYSMGDLQLTITPLLCAIGLLGGSVTMIIATAIACSSELKSSAAELLRPKAPKPGKRILLERLGFLWRRMPFSQKVTMRNLFRYKKRFITTILGVAGCCALLLTGLGLRDSIGGMLELQYEEISHASISVYLGSGSSKSAETALNQKLAEYGTYAYVSTERVDAETGALSNSNLQTWLFTPEEPAAIEKFITFRDFKSGDPIVFPPPASDEGNVVLTEKLARVLEAKKGDKLTIAPMGKAPQTVRTAGVTEHYIYNYIYFAPENYEGLFGVKPEYATVLLIPKDKSDAGIERVLTDLVATDNVKSATSTLQLRGIMSDIVESLNAIVWVIISVAGGLALVVLYNLTNINIIERRRELATLKVLGFFRSEVSSYVNRESILLTLIGIAFGLFAGLFLHRYIMTSVETDQFVFGHHIKLVSFIIAGLFTLLCSIAVNFALRPRMLRIDPVGALKSAE